MNVQETCTCAWGHIFSLYSRTARLKFRKLGSYLPPIYRKFFKFSLEPLDEFFLQSLGEMKCSWSSPCYYCCFWSDPDRKVELILMHVLEHKCSTSSSGSPIFQWMPSWCSLGSATVSDDTQALFIDWTVYKWSLTNCGRDEVLSLCSVISRRGLQI